MINKFRPRYPAFVDAPSDTTEIEFNTIEDLLHVEFVKRFADDPQFDCFRKSDNVLMAIYNDGYTWIAVGYVEFPDLLDLPEWDKGKYKIKNLLGISTTISGSKVAGILGNFIHLKDGRIRERIL